MSPIDGTMKPPYQQERSILFPYLVLFLSCNLPPTFKFSLVSNSNLFERYPFLVLRLETPGRFPRNATHQTQFALIYSKKKDEDVCVSVL